MQRVDGAKSGMSSEVRRRTAGQAKREATQGLVDACRTSSGLPKSTTGVEEREKHKGFDGV